MALEFYVKLAALAVILIIALAYPILSALVVTAAAAIYLDDLSICDIALVQKLIDITPPAIKSICMNR